MITAGDKLSQKRSPKKPSRKPQGGIDYGSKKGKLRITMERCRDPSIDHTTL